MLPELPDNFHEGEIAAIQAGPRRELTLTITGAFPDPGSNGHRYHVQTWAVRFGGIDNMEEVRAFCSPTLLGRRIGNLHYAGDEISRAHRLIVVLTMYDDDALLRIRCRNLTARQHLLEVSP